MRKKPATDKAGVILGSRGSSFSLEVVEAASELEVEGVRSAADVEEECRTVDVLEGIPVIDVCAEFAEVA